MVKVLGKETFSINGSTAPLRFGTLFQLPQGSFVLEKKQGEIAPATEFFCNWTPEEPLARGLAGGINVGVATKGGNVLNFSYFSENYQVAQDVVNGFLKAYQDYSLQDKREGSLSALSFIEDQLAQVKGDLNNVEGNLQQFREDNKVIAMASGDVIGILNADDLYADNGVIAKVAAFFEDPAVDATYADLVFVDREDVSKVVRTWKSGPFKRSSMYNGWMPPHPTFFVRRSMYEKYGLFNTILRSAADYELMLRFLLKHEINLSYIPQTIINMRQGGKSTASISNRIKANVEDRKAWRMNGLKPHFFTLILKPLRKIKQFISHG